MNKKSNKGITLISLIVTIVILIILTSISINLLFGENGIITTAKIVSEKNSKSKVLEELNLIIGEWEIENSTSKIELYEFLQKNDKIQQVRKNGESIVVLIANNYFSIECRENIVIDEYTDTGITYYISVDGTSNEGTDINNPMSIKVANEKEFNSGDTILLKSGDIFYQSINLKIKQEDEKITYIGKFGEEDKLPIISGAKILNKRYAWEEHSTGVYKIDLTNKNNFDGLENVDEYSVNIGFLEDNKKNKYYNRVSSLEKMQNNYDFYCDTQYLYIKSENNPYDTLGELKVATRLNLFNLTSNIIVENIKFEYTGAHAMVNFYGNDVENVTIKKCVIDNIGGSILRDTTRYGNGIEFYETNAKNIIIKENIIRNVYDVAFTIQGSKGSGNNVEVCNNVMINNSQDSEIWENGTATGVKDYRFHDNISINQGRGWGYQAREDKYVAASILFWGYLIEDTDINFYQNILFNPRRIYFVEQTYGTIDFFKKEDKIKSDNNTYYLNSDSTLFRDLGNYEEFDMLETEYNKDKNSIPIYILQSDKDIENITQICNKTDDITQIKKYF